ncbi:hypothetical protein P1J78_02400 [Psychromarinibacter sp. C21-152]|uniref:Uncharacterized protein n=1 Tax=Psychromarinibacter sediminicola TaxID=3033385 RepID=A0AAE3T6S5_9RHOB|nr:hypothetical protein [Psychromarinibacter sediminicola]MDF0599572.1 hypothetical protein [Psychromarinibacter sediminicola]
MSVRRWLMAIGLVLWLVLLGVWVLGEPPEEGALSTALGIAIVVLPLLLANEIMTLFQAWLRKRREKRDA